MNYEFAFDLKEIVTSAMILFAVIDMIGNLPIVVSLREKVGHIQSEKATIVATVIMILFLFLGKKMLTLIGIDEHSFAVAGSFILFFFAFEMILGIQLFKDEEPESASIFPLAFPLIAGAGSLTTLLSLRAEYHVENIIVGLFLNMIFVYIVLKASGKISLLLGKGGINIIRKVFGTILLAISVKLFVSNISLLLQAF